MTRSQAPRDPFGPVLPDRSRDEESNAWGDHEDDDERLRREVPPHHR